MDVGDLLPAKPKPVEEIIGWERHQRDTAWHPDGTVAYTSVWFTPPGVTVIDDRYGCFATVDDLLLWLRKDCGLIPVLRSYVGGWYAAVCDDNIREVAHTEGHETLFAALEDLVRKVDQGC